MQNKIQNSKFKIILFFILHSTFYIAQAQTPSWQWLKANTGGQQYVGITNFGIDSKGNTYFATDLETVGNIDIDTSHYNNTTATIALASYPCNGGTVRWVRHIENFGNPVSVSDKNGDTYCFTNGIYGFPVIVIDSLFPYSSNGYHNIILVKADSNGNRKFIKEIDTLFTNTNFTNLNNYQVNTATDDGNGNIDALIVIYDTSHFPVKVGNINLTQAGYHIVKFSKLNGSVISHFRLNINNIQQGSLFQTSIINKNGSYYISTDINNITDTIKIGSFIFPPNGFGSPTVIKFNNLGNPLWYKTGYWPTGPNNNFAQINESNIGMENDKIVVSLRTINDSTLFGLPFHTLSASYNYEHGGYLVLDTNGNAISLANQLSITTGKISGVGIHNNKVYAVGVYGDMCYMSNSNKDTIKPYTQNQMNSMNAYVTCTDLATNTYQWSSGVVGTGVQSNIALINFNNNDIYVAGFANDSIYNSYGGGIGGGSFIAKIATTNNCGCSLVANYPTKVGQNNLLVTVKGFSQSAVDSLVWSWGDGQKTKYITQNTNITHTYATSGTYQVCLTSYTTCGTQDSCFTVSVATSINDIALENIKIYPNPANNFITIENEQGNIQQVNIYNLQGKQLLTTNYTTPQNFITLPIQSLSAGLYMVEVVLGNGKKGVWKVSKFGN